MAAALHYQACTSSHIRTNNDNLKLQRLPVQAAGVIEQNRPTILDDEVSFEQLMYLIKSEDIRLLDVKTVEEVQQTGMMPTAINIPLSELTEALSLQTQAFKHQFGVEKPSREDSNIVFTCLAGVRSRKALNTAYSAGFKLAKHYLGGWEEYEEFVRKGQT